MGSGGGINLRVEKGLRLFCSGAQGQAGGTLHFLRSANTRQGNQGPRRISVLHLHSPSEHNA